MNTTKPKPKSTRTEDVHIRFSPEEKLRYTQDAQAEGRTFGQYVRWLLERESQLKSQAK